MRPDVPGGTGRGDCDALVAGEDPAKIVQGYVAGYLDPGRRSFGSQPTREQPDRRLQRSGQRRGRLWCWADDAYRVGDGQRITGSLDLDNGRLGKRVSLAGEPE